jgi:hypothetical protein
LLFITVVESVYCAVRTDFVYKADYFSYLKGLRLMDADDLFNAVVVVILVVGPISTAAMRAYCTLTPPMEFHHSSQEALHTKRRERPLLAKDGTKARKFS